MIWTGETLKVTVHGEGPNFDEKTQRKVFAIDVVGSSQGIRVLVASDQGALTWVGHQNYTVLVDKPPAKPETATILPRR